MVSIERLLCYTRNVVLILNDFMLLFFTLFVSFVLAMAGSGVSALRSGMLPIDLLSPEARQPLVLTPPERMSDSSATSLSDETSSTPSAEPSATIPEPAAISQAEYEQALAQPAPKYLGPEPGTTTESLEVHWMEYDDFLSQVRLGVALPEIPGLTTFLGANEFNRFAHLVVSHVLTQKGQDVYDKSSSFEDGTFDTLSFRPIDELPGYVEASRDIHVKKGTKERDLKTVVGAVQLFLPVDAKGLVFAPSDVGAKKTTLGAEVTFTGLTDGEYAFDYLGKGQNLLGFRGYAADGRQVEVLSRTADVEDAQTVPTKIFVSFAEPVAQVKVFVADKMFTKSLPFTLTISK